MTARQRRAAANAERFMAEPLEVALTRPEPIVVISLPAAWVNHTGHIAIPVSQAQRIADALLEQVMLAEAGA